MQRRRSQRGLMKWTVYMMQPVFNHVASDGVVSYEPCFRGADQTVW